MLPDIIIKVKYTTGINYKGVDTMPISTDNQYSSHYYERFDRTVKHFNNNRIEKNEVIYKSLQNKSIEYSKSYDKSQPKTIFTQFNLEDIPKEQIEKLEKIRKLSPINSYTYMRDFQETLSSPEIKALFKDDNGVKNNSFDKYASKMALTYDRMLSKIEEKYSVPDRETEYFLTEGGGIEELTKEKEIDMLNQSYERHSTFIASSMAIWKGLQDFNVNISYTYRSEEIRYSSEKNSYYGNDNKKILLSNSAKSNNYITKWAYSAFMSAIGNENLNLIHNIHDNADNIKLDLGLTGEQRNELNLMLDRWFTSTGKR